MILVDTSVWIDHFHKPIPALAEALERGDVLIHPFVIGELACGQLARRHEVLSLLSTLPQTGQATDDETLLFIDRHLLMGKGLGYIDVHLLASVVITDEARIWTTDKQLGVIARELEVAMAGA